MAKSHNQKMKILYLMQILQESDAEHVVSMQQILEYLNGLDIAAERKSIYNDLDTLRQFGMDICFQKQKPTGYYVSKDSSKEGLETEKTAKNHDSNVADGQTKDDQLSIETEEKKSSGTTQTIRLTVKEKALKSVLKRYGEDLNVKPQKDGTYKVQILDCPGPAFYAWITRWASAVHVVKPKNVAEEYKTYLKKIIKTYK